MPNQDRDDVPIETFHGLRNTVKQSAFALGDLAIARNVDIDDAKKLRRRKGFAATVLTDACHSIFSSGGVNLVCVGSALCRWFPDVALPQARTTLRTGLSGDAISYAAVGARIYYSDGVYTGCVDDGVARSWGIEPPIGQPIASASGGSLPAGTYQFAATFLRIDGQESGTGASGTIDLPATGGIEWSAIPVSSDPDVTEVILYVSPVNGDALYRLLVVPNGTLTATYRELRTGRMPLTTQFKQPPVAGQFVVAGHGRVYVARGAALHYTPAYAPELMDLRQKVRMPSFITLVAPVDDGLWLGTADEIIFLPGTDPTKWEYRPKEKYGAIRGAAWATDAENVGEGLDGAAHLVATSRGIVACLNGGIIKNLTKSRFQYPLRERGAAVARAHGGMNQYLMVLEGSETAVDTAF